MAKKKPNYVYGITYHDLEGQTSINSDVFREKKAARKLARTLATEALAFHEELRNEYESPQLFLKKKTDGFTIVTEDGYFIESWEIVTLEVQS
jgi:hypothetical protein